MKKGRKMKLKVLANCLLQQAEMLGDGGVYFAFKDQEVKWAKVSGIDLVHNGDDKTYTAYPLVDDSPSRML